MDINEIKKHLFSLANKGIKYDLQRMTEAARECGNPQFSYKSFHVAGTNGKGSTCAYLESMLLASGFKTALYTSPHILQFEERFRINGKIIDQEQWLNVYKDIRSIIDDFNLTFFEASTLIAFEIFKRNKVDWVVFETGLGGKLDATNIIVPQVSVITNIAIDHTQLLGKDIISIAGEKAGIIKKCVPAVVAHNEDPEVVKLFETCSSNLNAPLHVVSCSEIENLRSNDSGYIFSRNGLDFRISMSGKYQISNALLAVKAMECASVFDYNVCKKGLFEAFIPCRFQLIGFKGRKILLDVGHNPDAANSLVNNIKARFPDLSFCIITGIMKDKDYAGIIRKYSEIADTVIYTRPQIDRASKPEDLKMSVPEVKIKNEICQTIADAVDTAFKGSHDIICIAGSFHTVGEACEYLGINPFDIR